MDRKNAGRVVFIAAMGMMCSLMAVEIVNLQTWNDASTPVFVGKSIAHLGTVIAAFVAGKLIPGKTTEL